MSSIEKFGYIPQQIFLTAQEKKELNVSLATLDLMKTEFIERMIGFFVGRQDELHKQDGFSYPKSVSRVDKDSRVFGMKFSQEMKSDLQACVDKALRDFPGEDISERRVLRAMFELYLNELKKDCGML